ncbi:xylellain [Motilibacter rhizosphaerae]|uniref:Xylellain n=1 Tax=Motilibacter rhizosphaerae TaxID=598652 RepID=A0A4Q7NRS3_9ACTN|nr:C1 family peptidase [Motilibacter rhizosphaerae]RZS89761.1 xylellain [Motilibacter rhizosphaerae]
MAETPARRTARYGWVPDLPDQRDQLYAARPQTLRALPPKVDLRDDCPKTVYDQGRIGSCTANAIAAAYEFDLLKQGSIDMMPSRLFIYYGERAIEGSVHSDSGAQIRDGIKVVNKLGVCSEDEWPYDDTPPDYDGGPFPAGARAGQKPSAAAYASARHHRAKGYHRVVRALSQFKACLADGYPFVLGFTVYESFESDAVAQTGEMPMPSTSEHVLGGHAVLAVGYDDSTQRFHVRNSWGPGWGDGGYFTMPYAYLTTPDLSSDFWTIRTVA